MVTKAKYTGKLRDKKKLSNMTLKKESVQQCKWF